VSWGTLTDWWPAGRAASGRRGDHNAKQIMLLPPSLSDWLPADHQSHFVSEVVEGFDLSGIYGRYTELVLAANQQPDHWTLSNFRRRHHQALGDLFEQTVRAAVDAGLVKLKHVAVDGTKVKANASKHRAMSYERMLAEEKRVRARRMGGRFGSESVVGPCSERCPMAKPTRKPLLNWSGGACGRKSGAEDDPHRLFRRSSVLPGFPATQPHRLP